MERKISHSLVERTRNVNKNERRTEKITNSDVASFLLSSWAGWCWERWGPWWSTRRVWRRPLSRSCTWSCRAPWACIAPAGSPGWRSRCKTSALGGKQDDKIPWFHWWGTQIYLVLVNLSVLQLRLTLLLEGDDDEGHEDVDEEEGEDDEEDDVEDGHLDAEERDGAVVHVSGGHRVLEDAGGTKEEGEFIFGEIIYFLGVTHAGQPSVVCTAKSVSIAALRKKENK